MIRRMTWCSMQCETSQRFLSVPFQRFLTSALPVTQAAQYLKQTGHVNTYTFTKMLTEMAIAEFHNSSFPVAIVRPSIVVSAAVPATCFCLSRGMSFVLMPTAGPAKSAINSCMPSGRCSASPAHPAFQVQLEGVALRIACRFQRRGIPAQQCCTGAMIVSWRWAAASAS